MATEKVGSRISIEHVDPLAASARSIWAEELLADELSRRGLSAVPAEDADLRIIQLDLSDERASALRQQWQARFGAALSDSAESFVMAREGATVLVVAADQRGYGYALTELYDIVRYAEDPFAELRSLRTYLERPANPARSITRLFTSETIDRGWFHDHAFWDAYLSELAVQRFNRFSLGLGTGYDYLIDRKVVDNYLCFAYPFLVSVPGYEEVEAVGVSAQERAANLAMLNYIGQEATRRGIEFGLGLWNHAYRYDPTADTEQFPIRGLDATNHAEYARDGLAELMRACPDIRRLTFRVHFEGGVPEPTHDFWRVVLSGLKGNSQLLELDMHAKGVSDELLEVALDVGAPVVLSTKYWGEHMGLPYHQAAIRERERIGGRAATAKALGEPLEVGPNAGTSGRRITGTETMRRRSFTRYGYADFVRSERPFGIMHRVWPGTQRLLLWGDPSLAAGYGRLGSFGGAQGVEWFEPLSFMGKKGSAALGLDSPRAGRALYADGSLDTAAPDWHKFAYYYRLLGRAAYNPDLDPAEWRRYLRATYGAAAEHAESALSAASRILPLITVVHAPSTACNVYWPEMLDPTPLVARPAPVENHYADFGGSANSDFDMTPPYAFGNVSPLDPQLFYSPDEYAADVVAGTREGKYSPIEVAGWLETLAATALEELAKAVKVAEPSAPVFQILAADVQIHAHIGRYYAAMFRAAFAYALREARGPAAIREALELHRTARAAWAAAAEVADAVYQPDLPFGRTHYARGTWASRLEAIDQSLVGLEAALAEHAEDEGASADRPLVPPTEQGPKPGAHHQPPGRFVPGEALALEWRLEDDVAVAEVRLHFRTVNQALTYDTLIMDGEGRTFRAEIPAEHTRTGYPLQYYFEVVAPPAAWQYPGLQPELANQPYYVVHADEATAWGAV
ncbi:hypothetical protein [Actinopolymorpha pittospori]